VNIRKFLSALLIGSCFLSLPAINFDIPLAQNHCYAISRSEVRDKQERFEKVRDDYEKCKRDYEKAISRRYRNSSEVRRTRDNLVKAREKYRKAKREYEHALRQYDLHNN